jgi:flagellin-like protein
MKRGLSPVIAVVLLLLITIIAAGIIVAFVVPFVNDNLGNSGECFEVLGDLSFDETPFNCFNSSSSRTGFSIRVENDDIIGFRVALQATGSSNAVDIENGTLHSEFRMLLNSAWNDPLQVPERGGVRTYVSMGIFDKAELFPILAGGGKCELADDIRFNECEDPEAIQYVSNP